DRMKACFAAGSRRPPYVEEARGLLYLSKNRFYRHVPTFDQFAIFSGMFNMPTHSAAYCIGALDLTHADRLENAMLPPVCVSASCRHRRWKSNPISLAAHPPRPGSRDHCVTTG